TQPPLRVPDGDWPRAALFVWGLCALCLLARLSLSYSVLKGLKSRGSSMATGDLPLGRRGIRVLVSTETSTPLAAGLRHPAIVIPAALRARLSEAELRQIILHEAAHLARYDDWSNLAQKLIQAVFWLHPVVYWIGRRLNLEREIACDDRVLAVTGRPRSYAECLARLAELAVWRRSSVLATGAADNKPHLSRRIELLLDRTRNIAPSVSVRRFLIAVAALVVAVVAAGSAPELIALAQHSDIGARYADITWSDRGRTVELHMSGIVDFTDDERDVRDVSPGGWFRLEERRGFFETRRYEAADSSGHIARTYYANGVKTALGADGQAWLAAMLPEIFRQTCIDADTRIRRLERLRGPDGVLAEIALIHNDGCRRTYLRDLIAQGGMGTEQLRAAMRMARQMNSDGDKRSLLIAAAPVYFDAGLRAEIFDTVATVRSDGDRRRVLVELAGDDPGSPGVLALVAKSAARMNSDGDKATVLLSIAGGLDAGGDVRREWFRAANTIQSDGDRRRVLAAATAHGAGRRDSALPVFRSAAAMNSDGDKCGVLIGALGGYTEDEPARRAFFNAVNSIRSDGDRQRVLAALLKRPGLSSLTLADAADSARQIRSDGDRAGVLIALAQGSVDDPILRAPFFAAADAMNSDGDHGRVLMAVLSGSHVSPSTALEVVRSAGRMNSDGDKSSVLIAAAARYPGDEQIREAVRKTAEKLHSDGDYRRVMTALSRSSG
ncbi:MAG: M56 family metallopeptidase, partial [Bryobacteraceae bacterium]